MNSVAGLKLLQIGPYPPPHGGISVHVYNATQLLRRQGAAAEVVNIDPRVPASPAYIKVSNGAALAATLVRFAWDGWTLHTHINGHTPKSWWIALAAGVTCQNGTAGVLTIHSGIAPQYLRECSNRQKNIAEMACRQFNRVICVNEEIAATIQRFGIPSERLAVIPAFLPPAISEVEIPGELETWLSRHQPVISTAMFFRPEYGFEVLVSGIHKLIQRHPRLGCVVMGSGEDRLAAEMLVKQRELSDCVYFAGDIDHDMCLNLMSRSQVFVRPTFRDGDSISVREAVSLGIPVVASNVGTRPPEAVLFAAGDADELASNIEKVLATGSANSPAGTGGSTADQLLEIYSSLANA